MKIFHGPVNIGGMAGELARAHRRLGHDASAYCLPAGYGFERDREWPPKHPIGLFLATRALRFDVFQFYYGMSMRGAGLEDARWLKRKHKKVFFYFCGCDVRDSKVTIAKYRFSACKECWPMGCSPNRAESIEIARSVADGSFVSTPDLLEFVPRSSLLPQPLTFEEIDRIGVRRVPAERDATKAIRIVHAPTDRQKKGTHHIVAAVERLRARGLPVELKLLEGDSRASVLETIAAADIVVDQVLIGSYGMLSVEGMALGKAVVCYLREDLRAIYPEPPPIVNADPETLEQTLGELAAAPESWEALGARGRIYARRWHESTVIAKHLIQAYERAGETAQCV